MAEHSHDHETVPAENWDEMPAHRATYRRFTKLVLYVAVIGFIVGFFVFAYWY
jgi:hypothetical protein